MSRHFHLTVEGYALFGALAAVLIGLRLDGHIDWPWLWVLAPLWAPLPVLGAVSLLVLAVWLRAVIGALAKRMAR